MNVVSFRPVEQVTETFEGLNVTEIPRGRYTENEIIECAQGAEALFVHSENEYTRRVLESLDSLQVIGKPGAGIEHIDVEAATEQGIAVLHTPGLNAPAVAEYTVGALIAFARRLPEAMEHLQNGGWRGETWWGTELREKTIGLVGLGATGFETAKRLEPFDVNLLVTDPYVSDERIERVNAERVPLSELVDRSAVVSLHVKLTEETREMIGADEFDRMGEDSILVNTSRGEVVERTALMEALRNKEIHGAVLDVFHEEPPGENDPLFDLDNVLATPHYAAATYKTRIEMLTTTAENVVRVLDGEAVDSKYLANPAIEKH